MRHGLSGITAILCCLSLVALFSPLILGEASSYSFSLSSNGLIKYWPTIDVTINVSHVIGINNLSLGFMMGGVESKCWCDSSILRGLANDVSFKLVRLLSHTIDPCIYWNESTKTGEFNWTDLDALVQRIFEIGAEPLFCFGYTSSTKKVYLPNGMAINPITGLPYSDSYAAYAGEWVKHFQASGFPVRYYEIINEPAHYFGWNPPNQTKLGYYVEVWNTVARVMRNINPKVLLSQDCIMIKQVLEYWIQNGDDVDSLNFHKYDSYETPGYDDLTMFTRAETRYFETESNQLGIEEARQMWFNSRGKLLPIINSESNFNSAWKNGTDPRIQQMAGTVWTALVLRQDILRGISYNVYYCFHSTTSYGKTTSTGGAGFGMINYDDKKPWYPYYVHFILGNNLDVGDMLVESVCSSNDVRVLAWIHKGVLNVLIISKVDKARAIYFHKFEDKLRVIKIDNTIPWENAGLQTQLFSAEEPLIVNGYTVALLQKSTSP
jgi:hypothetical protein